MKWAWMLIVFLLVPIAGQAKTTSVFALIDGEYRPFGDGKGRPPAALRFIIYADADIENIGAKVELYMRVNPIKRQVHQGRCVMFLNLLFIPDVRDHLIHEQDGQEIWFPHLNKRDILSFAVFWDEHDPEVRLASITVESSGGHDETDWRDKQLPPLLAELAPSPDDGKKLVRVSLEEVCRSYTSQELAKGY